MGFDLSCGKQVVDRMWNIFSHLIDWDYLNGYSSSCSNSGMLNDS